MLTNNSEDAYDLTLDATLAVQSMRSKLESLPRPKWYQLGQIWRRSWLEGKIEGEIASAKFMQRASDWIEGQ